MSLQLRELVLYAHTGAVRRVRFTPGALNVITGESGTGKSAIINIVDYCFGRDTCPVPARVIRDAVRWYALLLQVGQGQVFVARAAPVRPYQTSSEVHLAVGDALEVPPMTALVPNTTPKAAADSLTRLMGVSPNLHVPPPGQTRDPLEATIQHAKLFAFQYQDEVAKRDLLFHRQGESSFLAQAIKDTLPYFLGAVAEDQLRLRQEVQDARRSLRGLERRLREAEELGGEQAGRAAALVREAQAVGLIPPADVPADATLETLRRVRFMPAAERAGAVSDDIRRLRGERATLQREYDRLRREIADAEEYEAGGAEFAAVAGEQKVRLESIRLFPGENDPRCPLCEQQVAHLVPTGDQVREALASITRHVEAVGRERPDLTEFLKRQRAEAAAVEARLGVVRDTLTALAARDTDLRAQQEQDVVRSRVAGKIELYLEVAVGADNGTDLRRQVAAARARVAELEGRLREEDAEETLDSILNQIGQQMTRWCGELGLEYSAFPLRLDLKRLTVVADTPSGPVPMSQMGSGKNWLWCHLLAHLALHKWFVERERPVPRFLILDQPSQFHYPAERDANGSLEGLSTADRAEVVRMFNWLKERVDELRGRFQVIVLDHAEVTEPWFPTALVERWRNGEALVPRSWIDAKGDDAPSAQLPAGNGPIAPPPEPDSDA